MILGLAERLGVPENGARVAANMKRRMDDVRRDVAARPRPRVFVAEWLQPPFAPGHWVPDMVEAAGGECVLGRSGEPSFAVTWDEVRAARPEVVIAAPCGYDRERAAREAERHVPDLGCPVVPVDANAHFSRCAPRIVDGVVELARVLHPGALAAVA